MRMQIGGLDKDLARLISIIPSSPASRKSENEFHRAQLSLKIDEHVSFQPAIFMRTNHFQLFAGMSHVRHEIRADREGRARCPQRAASPYRRAVPSAPYRSSRWLLLGL